MAKLDARFNSLETSEHTFSEVLFDKSNRLLNDPRTNKTMETFDSLNTKKFQVSLNKFDAVGASLLEQYRSRNEEYQENLNEHGNTNKFLSVKDSFKTDMTPIYSKNPTLKNNKITEINEISKNDNKPKDRSVLIEPSPSGITRLYIKYDDEAEGQNTKINHTHVHQSSNFVRNIGKTDSTTSPFVFLNGKVPEKVTFDTQTSITNGFIFY